MKKKNIIKKLMSVVLSAATVFSLLTLPAHAIIPGEDAYTGEGYVYIDYENKKTEIIPQSEVPAFTGTSTYDALNYQDRVRMEQMNAQLINSWFNPISPADVDTGTHSFITPTAFYTGVVLVAVFREGAYCTHGTGFMVDSDTFVTALHVVADEAEDGTLILPLSYEDEIRVYFNISENKGTLIEYEFFEDTSLEYYSVYSGMHAAGNLENASETMSDWYVGNLNDCVSDDVYFFDCYNSYASIEDTTTFIVGYPRKYKYQMVDTRGEGTYVYSDMTFATSNRTDWGMSGGPIYTTSGGLKCAGILVAFNDNGGIYSSFGISFHQELMEAIILFIT